MTKTGEISVVAVIDDIRGQAETAAGIAEEAGLSPIIISEGDGVFRTPEDLLTKFLGDGSTAAICDHRLAQTQFAHFSGAEFIAALYLARIPGVLVSTFAAIDGDTSIRLHRANIPYIIPRNALHPDEILRGLQRCKNELEGNVPPERLARRTLVRIVEVAIDGTIPVVDAIVHTWNPEQAIRFPIDAIDNRDVREYLKQGIDRELRLFARVNVGCPNNDEIFFKAFEFAPEPDIEQLTRT